MVVDQAFLLAAGWTPEQVRGDGVGVEDDRLARASICDCPGEWVMAFWAYFLLCNDGSYYTGHTDNLDLRIGQHQTGAFEGYTSKRRPVTLVWSQDFPSRLEALDAERRIKGWSRAKKEALI